MSKAVENVLNNKDAKATDYFELVNIYEYSDLSVHKDGNTVISMSINAFEEFSGVYEFKQKCSTSHFSIEESNVESVTGKMLDDMDTYSIEINMKDGSRVGIYIYHTDTNEKLESKDNYVEKDVFSLYDYFNQPDHTPMMAIIRDSFGMEVKVNKMGYISMDKESDCSFTLWITDEEGLSISFPLVDDSCNEIYMMENQITDTILICPYGQPFIEISILVAKESNMKRNKR